MLDYTMGTKFKTTKGTESVTYKLLFAIKITLRRWCQTACSKLALSFLYKAFHKRSNLLWRLRKNLEAKIT